MRNVHRLPDHDPGKFDLRRGRGRRLRNRHELRNGHRDLHHDRHRGYRLGCRYVIRGWPGVQIMRRLLALALGLCLCASQAFAGFTQVSGSGTGGAIFNTAFFGGATCSGSCPTTTAALNAGDILAVYMQQNGVGTPTFGCSDGVGNTWQAAPGAGVETGTGAATEIWYSKLANGITNGSAITCTVTGTSAGFLMTAVAFRAAGTGAFDLHHGRGHRSGQSLDKRFQDRERHDGIELYGH